MMYDNNDDFLFKLFKQTLIFSHKLNKNLLPQKTKINEFIKHFYNKFHNFLTIIRDLKNFKPKTN